MPLLNDKGVKEGTVQMGKLQRSGEIIQNLLIYYGGDALESIVDILSWCSGQAVKIFR